MTPPHPAGSQPTFIKLVATLQVAVASPEAVANALHPVRTSSVISDSNNAYLRRQARETQSHPTFRTAHKCSDA